MRWFIISVYVFCFFLMEYMYLPFEGNTKEVKVIFKDFSVRLDSYMYFLFIKVEQIIAVLIVQQLLPDFWKYTRWLVLAFFLALIEYPLTYNEPMYKILLPEFGSWQPYIPVSVAMIKFIAVCYFMYGCIKKVFE
jgi:hypothetical protein